METVITLDKQVYYSGDTIKGEIKLNLTKRTKIRAIKVQITGKGKCKWMEILRKNSNNESVRSLFYKSKEIYAHSEKALPVFEPRGLELSPGEHTFDFAMPLELFLPSSFKGSYGAIKYKLRVSIQRPWTFDERHTILFTVVKSMPLPPSYRQNPTSLEKQITKTISLFGARPITMLALLPEDFAVRGEPLRICVTVTNNSNTNVEKLRFTILQYISYFSHTPRRVQKMECIALASKETGAVHKKSERSFAHELLMPATAQPTDSEFSGVINISYELRVEAVLRGFFKNLVLKLPFKVYSDVPDNQCIGSTRPPPPSNFSENTLDNANTSSAPRLGNPFDGPTSHITGLPVYPTLDTSIGSPSHSSQFSESGSIYSTTSESSTATLSPAVGMTDTSYASCSSSLFNSPSARASLRSVNVPYIPYSNSPLMSNSMFNPSPHTTPYPLPDSPQYMLMQQYPSQTSHTLSMSFLQPPGAHELPPSYEELFGNATAPPETPK